MFHVINILLQTNAQQCKLHKVRTQRDPISFTDASFARVETLIVATNYLQLIQNRYMFRSFTVLHSSHQHCVQPVA